MRKKKKKLIKEECEICGETDINALQIHHIVERTEKNTTNHPFNCAILCASCHAKVIHKTESQSKGSITIIGVYPSTKPPNGRTLIYEKNGVSNCPEITEPYYTPKLKSMKIYLKEEK